MQDGEASPGDGFSKSGRGMAGEFYVCRKESQTTKGQGVLNGKDCGTGIAGFWAVSLSIAEGLGTQRPRWKNPGPSEKAADRTC